MQYKTYNKYCDKCKAETRHNYIKVGKKISKEVCSGCYPPKEVSLKPSIEDVKKSLQSRLERDYDMTYLGDRYKDATFKNYELYGTPEQVNSQKGVISVLKQLIAEPGACTGGIVIGTKGTGKNHLLAATGKELILKGYTVMMSEADSLFDKARGVQNDFIENTKFYEELTKADVLIVDEVSVQSDTDFERKVITKIVDKRYKASDPDVNEKPTIFVGNLSEDKMEYYIGDRAFDRIDEKGFRLVCDWDNYRRRGK
jgi:DNA replication protein DnaC